MKKFNQTPTTAFLIFGLVFVHSAIVAMAQNPNLIENGEFKEDLPPWQTYSHLPSKKPDVAIVSGPSEGSFAVRFVVPENNNLKKYSVGMSQVIHHDIGISDAVTIRFMARSPQSVRISAMVHTVEDPKRNKLYKDFDLTPEWENYEFTAKKTEGFPSGSSKLEFYLSFAAGEVEITNVELEIAQ